MKQSELLQLCLQNDRKAQHALYVSLAPTMKMVCLRYLIDKDMAEDILNSAFLKIFTKLESYSASGNFEGWARRIVINQCIDANRTHKPHYSLNENINTFSKSPAPDSFFAEDYLLRLIDALPLGYKTVFNLVEIDGFNHKEVASKLQITESASRSQLAKAKKVLRDKLKD